MQQRQLVAIVITADGKRVSVPVRDDSPVSLLARLRLRLERLLGR